MSKHDLKTSRKDARHDKAYIRVWRDKGGEGFIESEDDDQYEAQKM